MGSEERQRGDLNVMHCWRCKSSDHEASDKFCPKFKLQTSTMQTDRLRWSFEDPMYQYLQEQHKREKQERIKQLQSLLDDPTSSSGSDSSDEGKSKGSKKRKRHNSKKSSKHKRRKSTGDKDEDKISNSRYSDRTSNVDSNVRDKMISTECRIDEHKGKHRHRDTSVDLAYDRGDHYGDRNDRLGSENIKEHCCHRDRTQSGENKLDGYKYGRDRKISDGDNEDCYKDRRRKTEDFQNLDDNGHDRPRSDKHKKKHAKHKSKKKKHKYKKGH